MNVKSKSGFSLVELMVVVAIIGILATIAIPNFQRFQARSKQSSAKAELTGIFTAEKSFFTEYNQYHTALPTVGYIPEGVQQVNGYSVIAANRARVYATTAGVTATAANTSLGSGLPTSGTFGYTGYFQANTAGCAVANTGLATASFSPAAPAAAGITFVAAAMGCPASPSQTLAKTDIWSIDQDRTLANSRSGVDR